MFNKSEKIIVILGLIIIGIMIYGLVALNAIIPAWIALLVIILQLVNIGLLFYRKRNVTKNDSVIIAKY